MISRTKRALTYPVRILFSRNIAWSGILSQRYATKNPCGVGWGQVLYARLHQNRIEMAWKISCWNGPLQSATGCKVLVCDVNTDKTPLNPWGLLANGLSFFRCRALKTGAFTTGRKRWPFWIRWRSKFTWCGEGSNKINRARDEGSVPLNEGEVSLFHRGFADRMVIPPWTSSRVWCELSSHFHSIQILIRRFRPVLRMQTDFWRRAGRENPLSSRLGQNLCKSFVITPHRTNRVPLQGPEHSVLQGSTVSPAPRHPGTCIVSTSLPFLQSYLAPHRERNNFKLYLSAIIKLYSTCDRRFQAAAFLLRLGNAVLRKPHFATIYNQRCVVFLEESIRANTKSGTRVVGRGDRRHSPCQSRLCLFDLRKKNCSTTYSARAWRSVSWLSGRGGSRKPWRCLSKSKRREGSGTYHRCVRSLGLANLVPRAFDLLANSRQCVGAVKLWEAEKFMDYKINSYWAFPGKSFIRFESTMTLKGHQVLFSIWVDTQAWSSTLI